MHWQSYSLNIPENFETKASIGQVTAVDPDSGDFGKVWYSIPEGRNDEEIRSYFNIEEDTGRIRLTKPLDREKKEW